MKRKILDFAPGQTAMKLPGYQAQPPVASLAAIVLIAPEHVTVLLEANKAQAAAITHRRLGGFEYPHDG